MASAAEFLTKNCHFVAVPHAAYYSCVLLMEYKWTDIHHSSLDDLDAQGKLNNGLHSVLINEMAGLLRQKDYVESREFNTNIQNLRRLRVAADYKDAACTLDTAEKAIRLQKSIISILKKY